MYSVAVPLLLLLLTEPEPGAVSGAAVVGAVIAVAAIVAPVIGLATIVVAVAVAVGAGDV